MMIGRLRTEKDWELSGASKDYVSQGALVLLLVPLGATNKEEEQP